jgi:hypothetical protein
MDDPCLHLLFSLRVVSLEHHIDSQAQYHRYCLYWRQKF